MSYIEVIKKVLDLIAWPPAILILGITAMFLFRQPLSRLIDRTRKIGKEGLDASPQHQEVKMPELKPPASDELQRLFDNALLVQRESVISAELERLSFRDMTEREKFLIRLLAAAAITQQFEQTYSQIWGSQISALQFLNSLGASGGNETVLRIWYDQAAARDPQVYQNYSFDQWLNFMVSWQLILRNNQVAVITIEGREFLKYLLHRGYTLYKAG